MPLISNAEKMFQKDIHDISVSLKKIANILDRMAHVKKEVEHNYSSDEIKQLRVALGLPDTDDDLK